MSTPALFSIFARSMLVMLTLFDVRVMTTVAPCSVSSFCSLSPTCRFVSYSFTRVHLPHAPALHPYAFLLEPGAMGYSFVIVFF